MSSFSVKVNNVREKASDMKGVSRSVRAISNSVKSISNTLAISTTSSESVKRQLLGIYEQILDESVKMDSLSEALFNVANLYEKIEKKICNSSESTERKIANKEKEGNGIKDWFDEIKNDIREWLVFHGIINPQKQERKEGEKVTENQQKEQDLYMQSEIEKINNDKRFSEKTWKKASLEERKEILNEYIKKVAEIMGLDIAVANFFYAESQDGYATIGYYSQRNGSVHINEWVLEEGDENGFPSYDLFSTIVHELRHAYQDAVCNNPEKFVVTEETVKQWKESIDDYKNKDEFMEDGMSEEEAYEAYRNQKIEQDARNFAKQD